MKKRILIIFFILAVSLGAGIIYLNRVILPTKVKSLIIRSLEGQTRKKVSLESLSFNIFKGLVLKDLRVYDETKPLISIKEGSCTFLIWPFFKKQIILPTINLRSPVIFLQRRTDNTLDLQDLFTQGETAKNAKPGFNFFIYRISVTGGRINFQDDTLTPVFTKSIDNLNLILSLSLPASARFNLKGEIASGSKTKISAQGEFKILQQQFLAKIDIQDLSPQDFFAYYRNLGILPAQGAINSSVKINFKDNLLDAELDISSRDLLISKDKITGKLNSAIKASLRYNLKDKQLKYSGNAQIIGLDISGLELVERIENIQGVAGFDNAGFKAQNLKANCLGLPLEAKFSLDDFNHPAIAINLVSSLSLNSLQSILKDKFKLVIPADIQGNGKLSLVFQAKIPSPAPPQINGSLDISGATLKSDNLKSPIDNISGRIEFSQNQLRWPEINFRYLELPYKTSGTLTDFKAPGLQFKLSSPQLSLESILAINGRLIRLSKCAGRYYNCEFSLAGNLDTTDSAKLLAQLEGRLDLELNDLKELLKKSKTQLEKMRLSGKVHTQFNLTGDLKDFKSCTVKADFSSPAVSAYGLKSGDFLLNYNQANGVVDIPLARLSLYDGIVQASAGMNLSTPNLPYWISANIDGVKIEKLKLDTAGKDKDISGTLRTQLKINGFSDDLAKLSGAGQIFISEGKLWQLNLFKGLGSLLFSEDFTKIVFNEGNCGFIIQDKSIFTDNLKMKSTLANLSGRVKIGFDSSIDAALDVEVSDQAPLTGTFKDVTTAIMGQAGKFGVIKISGTLAEPKFKFKTAVVDIIKGLTDTFLKKR